MKNQTKQRTKTKIKIKTKAKGRISLRKLWCCAVSHTVYPLVRCLYLCALLSHGNGLRSLLSATPPTGNGRSLFFQLVSGVVYSADFTFFCEVQSMFSFIVCCEVEGTKI